MDNLECRKEQSKNEKSTSKEEQNIPKEGNTLLYSLFLGIVVMCQWQTIISSMDFFKDTYNRGNSSKIKYPDFDFPMHYFISAFIVIVFVLLKFIKIAHKVAIPFLLFLSSILCIVLPITSISIEKNDYRYDLGKTIVTVIGFLI